jgi:transcriptional regulator with XRE-family HTH domain
VNEGSKQRNVCGPVIRRLRQEMSGDRGRHLSIEELAARLEIYGVELSFGQLGKIERGEKAINDIQLYALAQALDVGVQNLYPDQEANYGADE